MSKNLSKAQEAALKKSKEFASSLTPSEKQQLKQMAEYGRKREWRHLQTVQRAEAEIVAEMQASLIKTLDHCEEMINAWYVKYAEAEGITIAEARKRAATYDVKSLKEKAKDYVKRRKDKDFAFSPAANREMRLYNFGMKVSRQELLKKQISLALYENADTQAEILGRALSKLTYDELVRQAGLLGMTVGTPAELEIRARAIVNASFHGETFSKRIWRNQLELQKGLIDGVQRSILLGENSVAWSKALRPYVKKTKTKGAFEARRLAVTEVGRVLIEAQRATYEIAGYEKFVVLCEPTACPICAEFDEEVFDVREMMQGVNSPMFHPFCHCTTAAYMDRRELEINN